MCFNPSCVDEVFIKCNVRSLFEGWLSDELSKNPSKSQLSVMSMQKRAQKCLFDLLAYQRDHIDPPSHADLLCN